MPYEAYGEVEFDVPVGKNGDTYDRYLVRMEEMRQANRIIAPVPGQAARGADHGQAAARAEGRPRTPRSTTASRGRRARSASTSSATARPTRTAATCGAPSFINLQSLPELAKGHLLADLVALIGTTDIVLGEVDR